MIEMMAAFFRDGEIVKEEKKDVWEEEKLTIDLTNQQIKNQKNSISWKDKESPI